jgi:hypothetical protein
MIDAASHNEINWAIEHIRPLDAWRAASSSNPLDTASRAVAAVT